MRTRVFFGWWVVLAFAVMVFLSTGIRFTVGPFLKPMVADLELDRASFSLVVALGLLLFGAFQPFVGQVVDRVGARPVVLAGTLVLAASLAVTGLVANLWQLFVVYGVGAAVGLAATSHVVGSAVISRWFARRRATALTVMGAASMAGTAVLVPLATWLVLMLGWRATYVLFGAVVLLVGIPLTLLAVRESPEAMGLTPDGEPGAPGPAEGEASIGIAAAMQTVPFWQIGTGLFTCGFSMSLISAHGVPMLTDHGYAPMVAGWAVGLLGGFSVVSAVVLGWLADRFGRRPLLAWIYGGRALVFAALFLLHDSPTLLLAVAIVGGATMSGVLGITAAMTADFFGRFSVGSVFGTVFVVHQAGAALGSWLSGFLFETTGGYGLAFTAASAILLAATVVTLTIAERPRPLPSLSPIAGGG